jgi:hypothetical protein
MKVLNKYMKEQKCNDSSVLFSLEKYDKDIEILNITHKQINGILDLQKFTKLKILICIKNNITEIINYPLTLTELYCNNNLIKSLDNLPCNLKKIDCSHNYIEILDNLPSNLEELICSSNYIYEVRNVPYSIKILNISNNKLINIDFLNLLHDNIIEFNCSKNKSWTYNGKYIQNVRTTKFYADGIYEQYWSNNIFK